MLRILILIGALGAGGVAAWLALAMQPETQPVAAVVETLPAPTTDVLVASLDLAQGQKLGPESLRWQPWPEAALNSGFITRATRPDAVETLGGLVVRDRFVAGDPIRNEKLAKEETSMLAAGLTAGMRAVAIRISAESSAGGLILPNDRVDVVHTASREGQDTVSRTILRNVRVLAIDQKVDDAAQAPDKAAVVGKTATLELDQVQTETITGAQASGALSLALRSVEDRNEASVVEPQSVTSVRILRAGHSETVTIR
ncbi:Flp pilus assembly protein CpaB [Microvirga yunnanensis]|uniref:Flp pilus assembly protein CpaB n=1 Tax=Microvirga yunnanensis TaxID=2953740 RepID=UPI0021C7FDF5|nr:Flp pilus assembly protein CpaB [Microvirga sp. HBU65207]